MAPKKDKSNYVFRMKEDQVLIKKPGDLDGSDFAISNCKNCEIYIFDHIAQIFVDDSSNCKVYIGPCKGSVFVRDCQGWLFIILKSFKLILNCIHHPLNQESQIQRSKSQIKQYQCVFKLYWV